MSRPEALAATAEALAARMIDALPGWLDGSPLTEAEQAAAFGIAAIGATMSFLVAAGSDPQDAAARVAMTAAGIAEDLS